MSSSSIDDTFSVLAQSAVLNKSIFSVRPPRGVRSVESSALPRGSPLCPTAQALERKEALERREKRSE